MSKGDPPLDPVPLRGTKKPTEVGLCKADCLFLSAPAKRVCWPLATAQVDLDTPEPNGIGSVRGSVHRGENSPTSALPFDDLGTTFAETHQVEVEP